ncbi:MAG: hypothetical protein HFI93_02155 [Lachnospiraceae bacterium]|nr:hypothetical protein [Lachnospiraceae bacterium]
MSFWDYLEIIVFAFMCGYFLWTAVRLAKGENANIPGFYSMTEADQACYDLPKLRKFYSIGNAAAAVAAVLLLVGQFGGNRVLMFIGVACFIFGYGIPYQLFKRSDFFIKK